MTLKRKTNSTANLHEKRMRGTSLLRLLRPRHEEVVAAREAEQEEKNRRIRHYALRIHLELDLWREPVEPTDGLLWCRECNACADLNISECSAWRISQESDGLLVLCPMCLRKEGGGEQGCGSGCSSPRGDTVGKSSADHVPH